METKEKIRLTKQINLVESEINDIKSQIVNQYPQPDGSIYLYGNKITVLRINELIEERNNLMSQRYVTFDKMDLVESIFTR